MKQGTVCVAISLLALIACLMPTGCASVRPIPLGSTIELGPNEGALLVHVLTNVPIGSLQLNAGEAAADLAAGEHVLLIALPAGDYRWSNAELAASSLEARQARSWGQYRLPRLHFWRIPDDMSFTVQPGRVNYVGMVHLVQRKSWELSVRVIDRTASALYQLERRFPNALERYPAAYSGRARHEFLQHYLTERDRLASGTVEAPSASGEP